MDWSQEAFWQKTKEYMQRAMDAYPDDEPMFAFWAHLALEFLARGALAYVHPILLADSDKASTLYSVELHTRLEAIGIKGGLKGIEVHGEPRTIGITEVFNKLFKVMQGKLTKEDIGLLQILIERRNEELHTGKRTFEDARANQWLSDFYHVSEILVEFQLKSLQDFWGKEYTVIKQLVQEIDEAIKTLVQDLIEQAKNRFEKQLGRERESQTGFTVYFPRGGDFPIETVCPACKGYGSYRYGQSYKFYRRLINEFDAIETHFVLPIKFECFICDLKLEGHNKLLVSKMGTPYSVNKAINIEDEMNNGYVERMEAGKEEERKYLEKEK